MSVFINPETGELVRDRTTHPAADAFPMASKDDLNALAVDIVRNGLQHPIVLTPAGEVLDGRNRLAACALVKVEPDFVTYDGDPWAYVVSANAMRRNLTTGQRAACVATLLATQGKRQNGRWVRGSVPGDPADDGDSGGSASSDGWAHRMKEAGVVLDWSTPERDLVGQVAAGTLALDAAYKHALDLWIRFPSSTPSTPRPWSLPPSGPPTRTPAAPPPSGRR